MRVRFLSTEVTDFAVDDLPALLERTDGIAWFDVPAVDDEVAEALTYVLMARRQRALVSQVADRLPGLEEEVTP